MNALIESNIKNKKLKLGFDKCFQLHFGKPLISCPQLKVDGLDMKKSSKQRYLGDLLVTSGKIDDNIEDRFAKGMGIINQIMSLLREVSFGRYFFKMAVMFRNSLLITAVLFNIEAAYGIKQSHIDRLELLDKILSQKKSFVSTNYSNRRLLY